MQSLADDLVPDVVSAEADANVSEIMAGDLSAMREAYPDETSPEFETQLENMAAIVRTGPEIARTVIGVQAGEDGYNIAHEVETPEGFTVIAQSFTAPNGAEPRLVRLDVFGSDTSEAARQRRVGGAVRLIGGAVGLALLLMLLILLRTRGKDVPTGADSGSGGAGSG